MKFRTLPGTDLNVSEVCLGTMTWGEQNSEEDALAQLDYALAQGVNFIDTAEMYPVPPNAATQGRTEDDSSAACSRAAGASGLVVATKVAGPGRRDWIRNGRTDLTRDVIAEAVDTSLARLKIDCIDLYQIHWPQRNVPMFGAPEFDPTKERGGPPIDEQVEALAGLVKAGKIRYYGLSNETAWGVCEFRRVAREQGVPGPGHDPEQLQPRLARRRQRSRRNAVSRKDVAARVQPARRRHPDGQVSRRFAAAEFAVCALRRVGHAVSQAHRARGRRGLRHVGAAGGHFARRARARLREEPLARGRDDHRRDVARAARGEYRGRAVRARRDRRSRPSPHCRSASRIRRAEK